MPSRVTMRSEITASTVIYEVYLDEVAVWRHLVPITRRNYAERQQVAREQEAVAFKLAGRRARPSRASLPT